MVPIIDVLISLGIVLGFFYMIFVRLQVKYPGLKAPLTSMFSGNFMEKVDKSPTREEKQQIWIEDRAMI